MSILYCLIVDSIISPKSQQFYDLSLDVDPGHGYGRVTHTLGPPETEIKG